MSVSDRSVLTHVILLNPHSTLTDRCCSCWFTDQEAVVWRAQSLAERGFSSRPRCPLPSFTVSLLGSRPVSVSGTRYGGSAVRMTTQAEVHPSPPPPCGTQTFPPLSWPWPGSEPAEQSQVERALTWESAQVSTATLLLGCLLFPALRVC